MEQVWLVTGASRGLGRAVASAASAAGHRVAATARNADALSLDDPVHAEHTLQLALDVTDEASVTAAVEATLERFGRIDVVVNNAGQADLGSVEDTPRESFWRQHAVSYEGLVNVTRAVLPTFRAQQAGRFIQVSSMGARLGTPGLASYQAAKAAATSFSMSLAAEVEPLGIRVTVIEPGNLRTEMLSRQSMAILPTSEPYAQTVGLVAERLQAANGSQPGDPELAAKVIVDVAAMPEPPRRLALGSDAVGMAAEAARRLTAEDERWAETAASIDFA